MFREQGGAGGFDDLQDREIRGELVESEFFFFSFLFIYYFPNAFGGDLSLYRKFVIYFLLSS